MIGRWAGVLLMVCLVPALALAQSGGFPRTELSVASAAGRRADFQVEVATTTAQMAQGLMFRTTLAPNAGMLFVFPVEQVASMWMKNTYLPLDMLFIRADGRIESIAQRTVPGSLEAITSKGRVKAVLELAGGTAERLGLGPGDRVVHPAFGRD